MVLCSHKCKTYHVKDTIFCIRKFMFKKHIYYKKRRVIPETYLVLSLIVAFFFNLPMGLIAMCISLRARKAYAGLPRYYVIYSGFFL